jgi:hypothetical protein
MSANAANAQAAGADGVAERVLAVRKKSSGLQFEMQWRGQQATTWEAASRMRRLYPLLVQAFEQQQSLQQQSGSAEGATDGGVVDDAQQGTASTAPADSAAMQKRLDEMSRLIEQQAQRAEEQQKRVHEQQALIAQLRASPANPTPLSALPPPQLSPQQEPRRDAAAAAAAAPAAESVSRFAKKEPRAQDLREYDGASGAKLDEWRDELALASMLFELNSREAVTFAVSRLRGTALRWWLDELSGAERALIGDSAALLTALKGRFQHATAAYTARQQLDKLQQGPRGVNEFIADFQRIVAQIGLPSLGEENALFAFERGLRPTLAEKLREHGVKTLREAIAMAARVGSLQQAAAQSHGRSAAANQMDVDEDSAASGRLDRIEAALNALSANGGGIGAKTQTQRGYQQERERSGASQGGSRGGGRGGSRGGRFGPRGLQLPSVPGVPEEAVRERFHAKQCLRCGREGHTSHACPNAISASGN